MANRFTPALTAAEWHAAVTGDVVDVGGGFLVEVIHDSKAMVVRPPGPPEVTGYVDRKDALAAMSLLACDTPILTWDHVRTLQHAADALPRGQALRQGVLDVIDRIVSLLPPPNA